MGRSAAGLAFLVALFSFASVVAQTPGTGSLVLRPIAPEGGRGVSNAALLNQAEVRAVRVDVEPGGIRNRHSHDDVQFHLFIPISGTMSLEVGSDKPVDLGPWQAHFIKGSTQHGFRNTGASTATVMEVFVKK